MASLTNQLSGLAGAGKSGRSSLYPRNGYRWSAIANRMAEQWAVLFQTGWKLPDDTPRVGEEYADRYGHCHALAAPTITARDRRISSPGKRDTTLMDDVTVKS